MSTTAALPPPPYPADTLARGWRFEVDMETFKRSDTWKKARTGALRGALLLLWAESWQEQPCGTLPDDDELIALMIDMPSATFAKHRDVLRRGWALASDGRLYHETITKRVLAMLEKRAKDAKRAADNRARRAASSDSPPEVTAASRVTRKRRASEFDTKHQAPSTVHSDPDGSDGAAAPAHPPEPQQKAERSAEDIAKAMVWRSAVAVLAQGGCPSEDMARSFMGKMVRDYTFPIVQEAVTAAVAEQPADAREYIRATCQRLKGERQLPNRQEAIEQRNRSVAEEWAAEQGAGQ